jgi:uncharacterized protein YndB with AHSA1/START domain
MATDSGRQVIQLRRELRVPIERAWQALIEPALLSAWYPFLVVALDQRIGGQISFDDGEGTIYHGEVKELDPPHVFSFTEADDLLHLELQPAGDGTRIILTHHFDDPSITESNETGWRECLDDLEGALSEC